MEQRVEGFSTINELNHNLPLFFPRKYCLIITSDGIILEIL